MELEFVWGAFLMVIFIVLFCAVFRIAYINMKSVVRLNKDRGFIEACMTDEIPVRKRKNTDAILTTETNQKD